MELESLPHILIPYCPRLLDRAASLLTFGRESLAMSRTASQIFETIMNSKDDDKKTQFVLDPCALPEIIAAEQKEPGILALLLTVTTTWCYSLNRERIKQLGK